VKQKSTPTNLRSSIPFNDVDVDGEEINCGGDKSNIDIENHNPDVTRKLNTYMDFSVILNNNKRQQDETQIDFGLNKTGLGNMTNNLWDISCIERKDMN
jgi:hypothetical protein